MGEFSIVVLSLAGCVFAASAVGKLKSRRAYDSFRDSLSEIELIPARILGVVTALLTSAEAVISAGLLAAAVMTATAVPGVAWLAEPALTAAAALTAVLATGVAAVIRHGTQAHCACFGPRSTRPLGRVHLARNLSLLAVICAGLAAVPLTHGHPPLAGAVLAAVSGAIAALLFIRWEDLADLFAPVSPSSAELPAIQKRTGRDG